MNFEGHFVTSDPFCPSTTPTTFRLSMRRTSLRKIAVVGFDDLDLATVVEPPLTVIDQDPQTIGRIAAEQIFGWLAGTVPTKDVVVPVRLIQRGSGEIPGPFRQP